MAPLPGTEPPELERGKIFKDTLWLVYCCCEGAGIGPFTNPLVAAEAKMLCMRSSIGTTDIFGPDGLCGGVEIMLCLTNHSQIPPLEEAPTCACVGKKCGGSKGSTKWHPGLFERDAIMDQTFWLYYFICGGVGLNKMDQGLFATQFKSLCCRGFTVIEPPVIDGVLCGSVGTECCFWRECQMPPAADNPKIAICGWRMNKGAGWGHVAFGGDEQEKKVGNIEVVATTAIDKYKSMWDAMRVFAWGNTSMYVN